MNTLLQGNITFQLVPRSGCQEEEKVVIMVSSGPLNKENRDRWRESVEGRDGVKIVFLIAMAKTVEDQKMLEEEHDENGDIVQSSLEDGHRKLGYKILSGYVWSYLHCAGARMVAKTDDNVELDMDKLEAMVRARMKNGVDENFMACGSGTQHRNMKPLRSDRTHMTGNWSISKEQLDLDIHPDFCSGFLYLTTPLVGAALVQAGHQLYRDKEVEQIEDSLITGVLREALPDVRLQTLQNGVLPHLWNKVFSHCPWLSLAKLSFSNDLVITKRSSRSNVQYVGSLTSPGVWRFFICLHLEFVLEHLEYFASGLVPSFIFDICKR